MKFLWGKVENTGRKGKMIVTSIFSFFHNVFKRPPFRVIKVRIVWEWVNSLLHRYSFQHINNGRLLKTVWEKGESLITGNFSFSHNVFNSIRWLYPHFSIFLTPYLYLLLNWKNLKLAYLG